MPITINFLTRTDEVCQVSRIQVRDLLEYFVDLVWLTTKLPFYGNWLPGSQKYIGRCWVLPLLRHRRAPEPTNWLYPFPRTGNAGGVKESCCGF